MKFLHAADVHLDSPLRNLEQYEGAPVDEIRGATRQALENLVQLAIGERVDFVLLAGDLYDGDWPDHNTGLFFAAQMQRLAAAGIRVYLVSGNHDAANRMTRVLRLPSGVTQLPNDRPTTLVLDELGVAIHGQGFDQQSVTRNVARDYPAAVPGMFNIGLLHTSLDGQAGEEHIAYAPCSVADLKARGYDYWALGHIHQRTIVDREPWIVYPGNMQGRHIRETGAKGCMLVTVDERGNAEPEFRAVDVFRFEPCHVDAADAETADDVLRRFSDALAETVGRCDGRPVAVRVTIAGRCAAHAQLAADASGWISQLRATAIDTTGSDAWVEKVRLRTEPADGGDPDAVAAIDGGPIEEIAEYIDALKGDPAALEALLRAELDELLRRLPDDVKRSDGVLLDDLDYLAEVLGEVEPLLHSRLMSREVGR